MPKYDLSDSVRVLSNDLTGRITRHMVMEDGGQAYIILLDNPDATRDGTFCARESEIQPQERHYRG
jgi:hypothetical protein